ncbi:MAG: glycosyltransferase [Actinomycetia bacterium]|nr:glycosyltransferase [Actinomycetes bacterium]
MSRWNAIRQFVPALYPNDAIGGHVSRLARGIRSAGIESEIFVAATQRATSTETRPFTALGPPTEGAVNVYHMATGCAMVDTLAARPEPLVTVHHNLTPLALMAPWDNEQVHELTLARRQLETLARRCDLGIGDSEFNRQELERLGFSRTARVPLVFDLGDTTPRSAGRSGDTVLFVGRIAPNKAQHDLIKALAVLVESRPTATLRLVGAVATPRYQQALERLVEALGLTGRVVFTGQATEDELALEYANASVLCCLSDHEGFGMPLIEAMARGVPVVAFASTAVPETIGDGGLVLPAKDPATVATALERVLGSDDLTTRLVEAGRRRAASFTPRVAIDTFLEVIERLPDTGEVDR